MAAVLVSDNVLQDGDIIESHYVVERRNRTIYKRMREYMYELTHNEGLVTTVLRLVMGSLYQQKIKYYNIKIYWMENKNEKNRIAVSCKQS